MPLYQYDSLNRRGQRITGTLDAPSMPTAKEMLQGQGLMPVKIVEVGGEKPESWYSALFEKKIETKTVIIFTKQLSVLLKSAVPLLQAIELLTEQFEGKFRRILINIKDGLKSGEPLAKEMERYPKVFSNVYVQLVRAGEATGKLDSILLRLTSYLERAEDTKKRIKKAMSYPIMMLSFSGLVVVSLLTTLVPQLTGMFEKMGKELPGPTQLLVAISKFVQHNYLLMIIFAIGVTVFTVYWKSTAKGRYKLDELFLKMPVVSYFSQTKAIVQFSKTLGMLLESGVNLSEALNIVCNIVENNVLTKKLADARDKIIKEGKIAKYLKDTGMFPNIASYMISTGEQSGKLADMLLTVGEDYDNELRERTDSLTAKIAPVMTLFMAVVIGFIVLSIFLPIISMSDLAGT